MNSCAPKGLKMSLYYGKRKFPSLIPDMHI
jgi:hypothetical protein